MKSHPNHVWEETMWKTNTLNVGWIHVLDTKWKLILKYQRIISVVRVCVLRKCLSRHCCLLGGLAVEELSELIAGGPCRCHPDAEETPTEHAHLNPCSAQKHEMETVGSAGTMPAFMPHRYAGPCLFLCEYELCVISVYICACVTTHVKNKTSQTPDTRHQNPGSFYKWLRQKINRRVQSENGLSE